MMRIGEVARRARIPASTLRYYEEIGLIAAPPRKGGQRVYDNSVFEALTIIQLTQKAGFSLAEIHQLLRERDSDAPWSATWRHIVERKRVEIEQTIQDYQAMLTLLERGSQCDCTSFDDCLLSA
jgi:DNA-binding transcriptional MerR regulator